MVVAETLAGLALINSTVKGIKSAIGTAQDISSIASDIDNLFKGKEEVKKQSHPIASKWDSFLGKTLGSTADRLSIGAIAKETIEEKLAEEQVAIETTDVQVSFNDEETKENFIALSDDEEEENVGSYLALSDDEEEENVGSYLALSDGEEEEDTASA